MSKWAGNLEEGKSPHSWPIRSSRWTLHLDEFRPLVRMASNVHVPFLHDVEHITERRSICGTASYGEAVPLKLQNHTPPLCIDAPAGRGETDRPVDHL